MTRYRVAQAISQDRFREVLKEDTELLAQYGLKLLSVQAGISAAVEDEIKDGKINPWNVINVNDKTWKWLHPLLLRLRAAEAQVAAAAAAREEADLNAYQAAAK